MARLQEAQGPEVAQRLRNEWVLRAERFLADRKRAFVILLGLRKAALLQVTLRDAVLEQRHAGMPGGLPGLDKRDPFRATSIDLSYLPRWKSASDSSLSDCHGACAAAGSQKEKATQMQALSNGV